MTDAQKESYALGRNIGQSFQQQGIELEYKFFTEGLNTALDGKPSLFSQEEMREILTRLESRLREAQRKRSEASAVKNIAAGKAFLAANKKKKGVVELPSGLQYRVLKAGTGKKPAATSTVRVHYKGTLIDGQEFDSSYSRGTPAEFPVNRVIAGWTEALQLMGVGSTWELSIPAELAYGNNPPPGLIKPGSTLLFTVELLDIVR